MATQDQPQNPSTLRKLFRRLSVNPSGSASKFSEPISTQDAPATTQNGTATTTSISAPDQAKLTPSPRIMVIGAGSRGTAYARCAVTNCNAVIAGICEPVAFKRAAFGKAFIWGKDGTETPGTAFEDWQEWVAYEVARRERVKNGQAVNGDAGEEEKGVDAVFVCVLDEMHEEVAVGIAGLGVHVLLEKPLSTRLSSCMNIYQALSSQQPGTQVMVDGQTDPFADGVVGKKDTVFGICHVLRYSPHNMMLRQLVQEEGVVGDVLSVEHVEPVGWWHFSHSYVRGHWRKESKSAPSLLTKSCHDIDFLMWLLCTPPSSTPEAPPHLPAYVSSHGARTFFRKERKPEAAGAATNCLSCLHEENCDYSAKKIYVERHLKYGNAGWPVKIVNPEIEDIFKTKGKGAAKEELLKSLAEDYTIETPMSEVEKRPWFGRCVFDADNDVLDDQTVTITWEDDAIESDENGKPLLKSRGAKTAQFHMVAFTEKICERRGRIYGTKGEIEYDSETIKVHTFTNGMTKVHTPRQEGGGHGGGDNGLVRQFLTAAHAVDSGALSAQDAQRKYLGCDLEEAFRSHAMVFAAEEARTTRTVVDWKKWWSERVESQLQLHER